ncbi:MAG TPA: protein kinase [Pirellulaceae bacterium]|nr:protein kinase [Pirellulaceae bacterium]
MAQIVDGQTFGRFQIVSRLGRGGMATVYRAYEHALDRTVALKVLPEDLLDQPGFVERFVREARVIARLEHTHIVPLYANGIDEGQPWMALRLVKGGHLGEWMENGALQRDVGLDYLAKIADALDFAHSHGIVHRDLKPQNVLLGERGECYVADFGIASMLEGTTRLTQTGASLGTPQYMAPEQAKGEAVGPPADIYALGIIVYQWLTGLLPFDADTPYAVMFKHVSAPLPMPPLEHLPERARQVIARALAKRPEDRWPTASAFVQALRASLAEPVPTQPTGAPGAMPAERSPAAASKQAPPAAQRPNGPTASTTPQPSSSAQDIRSRSASPREGHGKLLGALAAILLLAGGGWAVLEWRQGQIAAEEREGADAAAQEEAVAWQQAQQADEAGSYAQYLARWPQGRHAGEASQRQIQLEEQARLAQTGDAQREIERIRTIQSYLSDLGYRVAESGEADTRTVEAIKAFEQQEKLVVTGTPDELLVRALRNALDKRDQATWAAATPADMEIIERASRELMEAATWEEEPETEEAPANGGFVDLGNGRLRDTRTGLVWTQSDNGRDIDWNAADAYCRGKGMRLPSLDELAAIHDRPGAGRADCGRGLTCKISPLFRLTSIWFLSGTKEGSDGAWLIHLVNGYRSATRLGNATSYRALCVGRS